MPNLVLLHTLRATLTAMLMLAAVAGATVAGPYEDGAEAYRGLTTFRALSGWGQSGLRLALLETTSPFSSRSNSGDIFRRASRSSQLELPSTRHREL
jgi:hypothetical protein